MNNETRHINDNRLIVDDPGSPDSIIYYKEWIKRREKIAKQKRDKAEL